MSSRTPWHQSALVAASLESPMVSTLRLDSTEPLDRIVAALNEFQPESLVGYASMMRELAEEQLARRLAIAPKAVMSASEVLTKHSAARIELAFGLDDHQKREDVLFLGPPGTGKSHLAQAIGRAVIQQGVKVIYREAHMLLEELADATLDGNRKDTLSS